MGAARTKEQKLFGAACLKLTIDASSASGTNEIYEGALKDLGLTDQEVVEFLSAHRQEVEDALRHRRRKRS